MIGFIPVFFKVFVMKHFTFCIILFFISFLTLHSQIAIPTRTIKDCKLLSDFKSDKFQTYTPVKAGTQLLIVGKWDSYIYTVLYKDIEYQVYCGNIEGSDCALFNKKQQELIIEKRNKEIRDSIIQKRRENSREDSLLFAYCAEVANNKEKYILAKEKKQDSINKVIDQIILEAKNKYPIYIKQLSTSYPNSAGGVDLIAKIVNLGTKTIKYVTFTGYPLNAVDDKCYCGIRRYSTASPIGVGPIDPNKEVSYQFENLWYNGTISKYVPVSIKIEYMDGTYKTVPTTMINALMEINRKINELRRQR